MARPALHAMVAVRGGAALIVGAGVALLVWRGLGVAAAVLAGWATAAAIMSTWTLVAVWPMDAARTRTSATAEDPGRGAGRVVAVVGSIASIGAVVVVLTQSRQDGQVVHFVLAGLALASVVSSWLLVHTVYLVRIADLFYHAPEGGIDFPGTTQPEYTDFAYIAFGVGMTFQVADTSITSSEMRRVILAEALLGYLFSVVILGTIINLLANL